MIGCFEWLFVVCVLWVCLRVLLFDWCVVAVWLWLSCFRCWLLELLICLFCFVGFYCLVACCFAFVFVVDIVCCFVISLGGLACLGFVVNSMIG